MIAYNEINTINNLKLYLRHKYYPCVKDDIQNMFGYDKNYILDATFDESNNMAITLNLKQYDNIDAMALYNYIDGVLLSLYAKDSIDRMIFSDNSLNLDQKNKFISIHQLFTNTLSLLRYMYSVVMISQTVAIIYL